MSIFLKTINVTCLRQVLSAIKLTSGSITDWLYHGISEGLNKLMQLPKALQCISEKWLVFEEPQHFREGKDSRNHLGSLVQKRAKATYWSCIWIRFECKLKSNYARNWYILEIKEKLAVSFPCPFVSLHWKWASVVVGYGNNTITRIKL